MFFDPPIYGRQLPSGAIAPLPDAAVRLAPGTIVPPQALDPPVRLAPGTVVPPHALDPPPAGSRYEPASAAARPYPGVHAAPLASPGVTPGVAVAPGTAEPPDALRPPLMVGPDPNATGAVRGNSRLAALPPDIRPETGPVKALSPHLRRTLVDYRSKEPAGTIIVDTSNTYLYLVLGSGKAMRYGIGVGREGFTWAGSEKVTKMAEWPDWHPPTEMIERQPYLPRFMAGGDGNPLGARALYLGKTIYRIHGTNQPSTIGTFVSSGCIRLTNEDVVDLYTRVKVGTRVVVLPGSPPPAPPAMSLAPPGANGAAPISMPPTAAGGVPVEASRRPPPPFVR